MLKIQKKLFAILNLGSRRRFPTLSVLLACCAFSVAVVAGEKAGGKTFQVITNREGDVTRFFVENREANEVTATFEIKSTNLKATTNFPFTATYPANKVTEAFSVFPDDPSKPWNYSYTSHYTVGSTLAKHDDSYIYRLPFAPGASFKVTQAYNGKYSHHGSDQYAIDFKMPNETPVHAARGGIVAKIKQDSSKGGPDRKHENHANYVLIRHDDGTLGNYAHLAKNGVKVAVGQRIEAGDLIALSGNTGFSSGAHLHFSVFKTRDGKGRVSIPVKFETANETAITLVEGTSYRSSAVKPGTILAVKGEPAPGASDKFQGGQKK
ncbi:MAG: M23 family metallopeptidase [Verrucomicrobia subdivision 3 bacterium]|nr:M23 family metallopeptidase [Limisphaerales bacterium]